MSSRIGVYAAWGEIKILCEHHHVHKATEEGWQLIEVVHSDQHGIEYEECSNCRTSYSGAAARGTVYRKALFIMGRDADDVLKETQDKLAESRAKNEELNKRAGRLDQELTEAKRMQGFYKEESEGRGVARDKAVDALQRYEVDIGKLKEHFGKKACDEVLGGEEGDK